MIDVLAPRCVMLGDNARQGLDDDQLYMTADLTDAVNEIQFLISPSLHSASDGVTVTVADLETALAQFGLSLVIS